MSLNPLYKVFGRVRLLKSQQTSITLVPQVFEKVCRGLREVTRILFRQPHYVSSVHKCQLGY